ncbi:MAG: DOMON domain-containing protein [Desulfocapsaceae bacterium]
MEKLLSGIVCLLIFGLGLSTSFAQSYDHEVEVKGMTFAWKIDGDTLHGKMSAKTEGWVAVGFNPSSKMKDATYVLGFVKDGKAEIADHFGDKATGHSSDTKLGGTEDAVLVGGTEENGFTTIEFTYPMNSSDKYDSVLDKDGDTVLLLAYGPDKDSLKPRHKYKTSKTVNLGSGAVK